MLPSCDFQPNTEPALPVAASGGTVTSFSFTNENGFTGVVTNSTTTPNLTLSYSPTFSTTATAAGTTTLTSSSTIIQEFTGTTTQTIKLPATTTISAGKQFMIINNSTGTLTIQSAGAGAINTLTTGVNGLYTCVNASVDGASSWDYQVATTTAGGITTPVSIANGGTNNTAYTAPSGTICPIIYYDGTKFNTDTTVNHLAYDTATDTVYTGAITVSSATTQTVKAINTAASSPTAGGGIEAYTNDGAAMASGDRTAFILFGGAKDGASTLANAAIIESFATENWSGTATGSKIVFSTTANTTTTRSNVLTLNQDKSANFAYYATSNNFVNGFTTTATAAGTTTLTVASNQNQAFTGSTTQTVKLPVTTTLSNGFLFRIINQSSGTLTIQTGGASAITTILGGLTYEFICIDATSDVAASWYWRALYNDAIPVANGGTGQTSLPSTNNASQIVVRDSNKIAFASNFVNGFTTTATAAGTTTLTVASNQIQEFTGTTTQTIKLPSTTTLSTGFQYYIINNSTGTLTIQSNGGSAITTLVGGQNGRFTCINSSSDGVSSWDFVISLIQIATQTFLGRVTAGTGNFEVLSQANAFAILGSGTPSSSTYLRGDGIWAAVSATPPLGSMINLASNNSTNTIDYISTTDVGKWLQAASSSATAVIGSNYSSTYGLTTATTYSRVLVSHHSGTFAVYQGATNRSTMYQTTTDFSSFTNREIVGSTISQIINTADTDFWADYSNGKAITINFGIGTSGSGYAYTIDGTSWTQVYKTQSTNAIYNTLTFPCISGTTKSFYDSSLSTRVYTTNDTSFSSVTGTVINQPIARMANGYLYQISGGSTNLYVSTNDGQTWTTYTLPNAAASNGSHPLDFDGTIYVYTGSNGTIYSSTDLSAWTSRQTTAADSSVFYLNSSTWIALKATSGTTSIWTSTAPTSTWTNRTSANSFLPRFAWYCNSRYFVMGSGRTESSSDLSTWTSELAIGINAGATQIMASMFGGSTTKFAFVNSNNAYYYTGGAWTTVTNTQSISGISNLTFGGTGNGIFIRVKS
jgi:hypothetical protein